MYFELQEHDTKFVKGDGQIEMDTIDGKQVSAIDCSID